jgi:putative effector of murein hydrolase LrgA (UPF0299 family)
METWIPSQQTALALAAIWLFLFAGHKTARYNNYWIPGLALAAAILLSIVRGRGFDMFVVYGVTFMVAFLPTLFWPEIKSAFSWLNKWRDDNPSKDAVLTVAAWTMFLSAGWLGLFGW